ncbi:hypothetical protein PsYK624_164040 [Phanerochaete sordida]|uniref:F-box domain-containing protein n=1 Tax=Phanerochaete sordida TaxID=48140 RepID=A0A9P3GT73_9APHY|nr:hypothetical protein PsYK624_164040 [Phanerochaete sordida]
MHRALRIDEVLQIIFSHFSPDPRDSHVGDEEFENQPKMLFDLGAEITRAITSLSYLTSLYYRYPHFPLDAVVHISQSRCLSEAALYLDTCNQDAPLSPAWGGFPALTNLWLDFRLNVANCIGAATFVQRLSGVRLTRLVIYIQAPTHGDEFGQLVSAVGHLKRLQVCEIWFDRSRGSGHLSFDGTALAPLYSLTDMRDFDLGCVPIVFSPHAVRALTRAWGRLERFDLYNVQQHCYMSLESLAFFAENCPSLSELSLKVSPVAGAWRCDPNVRVSASRVTYLYLQDSVIDPHAREQVMAYLAKMFPLANTKHIFPESEE